MYTCCTHYNILKAGRWTSLIIQGVWISSLVSSRERNGKACAIFIKVEWQCVVTELVDWWAILPSIKEESALHKWRGYIWYGILYGLNQSER